MKSERHREISWEKDIWQWHLLQREKGKKETQIARSCLGSVEGEQISKNITLQMEQSPVCLNLNFPGASQPTESTLMAKHPMYCLKCKVIINLHAILFYFIFDPSYTVFISVGLALFTEN